MDLASYKRMFKLPSLGCYCLLLVLTLALSACGNRENRKVEYLERAKAFFVEQNFEKARVDVRNAIQIDENYVDARFLSAQLYEVEQNWQQMAANLRLVLDIEPTHNAARLKYGTLLMASRAYDQALEHAELALEQNSDFAEAWALKAAIEFQQGNNNLAIAYCQEALLRDEGNISSVAVLTEVYKVINPALALETIERGIAQQSESEVFQLMRISVFEANNDIEAASSTYESLIADNPDNLYFHHRYVTLLESNALHDEAADLIRTLVIAKPDEVHLKLWLVQYLVTHKDLPTAEKTLRNYIEQYPSQFDLQLGLGSILLAQEKETEARNHFVSLVEDNQETELAQRSRLALAELEQQLGNEESSERWLGEMLDLEPENPDALILRASRAMREQNYVSAINQARVVLRNRPDSVPALSVLGQAHLSSHSTDLARDNFQRILTKEPQNQLALTRLARLALREKNADVAQEYAATALRSNPQNIEATRLLVSAYTQQGNIDDAIDQALALIDSERNALLGNYLLGAVYLTKEDYPAAAEQFRTTLALEPRVNEALTGLVKAHMELDDAKGAIEWLDGFVLANPKNAHARVLQGQLYRNQKDYARAVEYYEQAIKLAPTNTTAYQQLGDMSAQAGDGKQALVRYEQGLQKAPADINLIIRKAQALETLNLVEKAMAAYEQALSLNGELLIARNNLAVLLVEHDGNSDDALLRAVELTRPFVGSKSPALLDTLGWVYHRLGDSEQAVSYLKRAIENGGGDPVMHFHLGLAQVAIGDSTRARTAFETALELNDSFDGAAEARENLRQLL